MRPFKDARAPCSPATMLISGLSILLVLPLKMKAVPLCEMSRIFTTIAKINSKLLTAFVRPLADSRNPRQVKDLRRRCSDDANDLDTIRAGAPEYGQMRSAAFGS